MNFVRRDICRNYLHEHRRETIIIRGLNTLYLPIKWFAMPLVTEPVRYVSTVFWKEYVNAITGVKWLSCAANSHQTSRAKSDVMPRAARAWAAQRSTRTTQLDPAQSARHTCSQCSWSGWERTASLFRVYFHFLQKRTFMLSFSIVSAKC